MSMQRWTVLFLAFLAILCGWIVWEEPTRAEGRSSVAAGGSDTAFDQTEPEEEGRVAAPPPPGFAEGRSLLESESASSQAKATTSWDPAKACTVQIWLGSATEGLPIADAPIALRFSLAEEGSKGVWQEAAGRTGAGGGWQVEVPFDCKSLIMEAGPAAGFARTLHFADLEKQPLTAGGFQEFRLKAWEGWTLAGQVVQADGQPVTGMHLKVNHGSRSRVPGPGAMLPDYQNKAETDAQGAFEITGMPRRFRLTMDSEEFGEFQLDASFHDLPKEVHDVRLELFSMKKAQLRIVSGGKPVAGATVTGYSWAKRSRLDMPGLPPEVLRVHRFRSSSLPAKQSNALGEVTVLYAGDKGLRLHVQHPDYLKWYGRFQDGQGQMEIELKPPFRVLGQIRDSLGRPVAGAELRLHLPEKNRGRFQESKVATATSGADGAFSIPIEEKLPLGSAVLCARAEHMAPLVISPLAIQEGMIPLALQMEPELQIAGKVLDREGQPVAGLQIRVSGTEALAKPPFKSFVNLERLAGHPAKAESDEQGNFAVGQLLPGLYKVEVRQPGDPSPLAEIELRAGVQDAQIVLGQGLEDDLSLRLQVLDGESQEAMDRIVVEIWQSRGRRIWRRSLHGNEGRFELRGLPIPSGQAFLRVESPGYGAWLSPSKLWSPGIFEFQLSLFPGRHQNLRLMDEKGRAFRIVEVEILNSEGQKIPYVTSAGGRSQNPTMSSSSRLDANGWLRLRNLPAETLQLHFLNPYRKKKGGSEKYGPKEYHQSLDLGFSTGKNLTVTLPWKAR
ncbi:MAG: carboxypeptidase regulatory-like domain-containing protein [Planctomycetota bacterium]|nr:MAG: carboxypeptidase regulatory-like domain-containing protein [Planctomycetota bacterium]